MKQFFKDNLNKQFQFLGLVVGFWALLILNGTIYFFLTEWDTDVSFFISTTVWGSDGIPLGLTFITIFQMWVIVKYIEPYKTLES